MTSACSVSPVLPAVSSDSAEDGVGGDDEFAAAGSDDEQHDVKDDSLGPKPSGGNRGFDGEGQEEALRRRPLASPDMPSASDVSHHKTTHCPYRSWCDECVEAFGREWPHHSGGDGRKRSIPVIHMDYDFLTDRGLFKRDEISNEDMKSALTILTL